uniref:Uncharacterized protein n=1 Tax=Globisporangium ultimum (strain ATCC 200006 / CBS 805.95 / DAOM BR144) TaxID=431595 RepID=K3XCV1_GLOUD
LGPFNLSTLSVTSTEEKAYSVPVSCTVSLVYITGHTYTLSMALTPRCTVFKLTNVTL